MADWEKRSNECMEKRKMEYKNVYDAFNALQKSVYQNMVPKSIHDYTINEHKRTNATLKSQLQNAKNDLEKLQSEYGNRKLSDTLKIDRLEVEMKTLQAENSELQNVKNELEKLKSEIALKIDVLEAGMKTLDAEKRTIESKFDEVSVKLKLKTHEYDSLLNSKQDRRQVKLVFKQNETEKTSIGIQTIKEEPIEIGVVNVPASFSSQPKEPPVKSGTKRTSSNVGDRKIVQAMRMKTEKSNSTPRITRQSITKKDLINCSDCFGRWGSEIEYGYDGDPDKTGAPNPSEVIKTFSSLKAYENHVQEDDCYDVCPVFYWAQYSFSPNSVDSRYQNADFICKICDSRFVYRQNYERHIDIEHCNSGSRYDITKKQMFDLYLKHKTIYSSYRK